MLIPSIGPQRQLVIDDLVDGAPDDLASESLDLVSEVVRRGRQFDGILWH